MNYHGKNVQCFDCMFTSTLYFVFVAMVGFGCNL